MRLAMAAFLSALAPAAGLAGEAGEFMEHVKKIVFHKHEFDPVYAADELGDVAYYWAVLCYLFDLDPAAVLQDNIAKLRVRYPDGFTEEDSRERKDTDG